MRRISEIHRTKVKTTTQRAIQLCIGVLAALLSVVLLTTEPSATSAEAERYQVSYIAGGRDAAGRFMGGTELRSLVAHGGKVYAGIGYWKDKPGPEGPQGAAILALDGRPMPSIKPASQPPLMSNAREHHLPNRLS